MSLKETINNDIKTAMKAKDKETLAVLRMIKTAIQAAEIDKAKQRRDSIVEFEKANRPELVEKTQGELVIVEKYLPAQLSLEEVQAKIAEIAEQVGATTQKEFGKLMGAVMQALKGQADGNVIKEQVKAHLNK